MATVHILFTPVGELWYNGHLAIQSIMPAFSGIAKALGKTIPELHGKFAGEAHVSL